MFVSFVIFSFFAPMPLSVFLSFFVHTPLAFYLRFRLAFLSCLFYFYLLSFLFFIVFLSICHFLIFSYSLYIFDKINFAFCKNHCHCFSLSITFFFSCFLTSLLSFLSSFYITISFFPLFSSIPYSISSHHWCFSWDNFFDLVSCVPNFLDTWCEVFSRKIRYNPKVLSKVRETVTKCILQMYCRINPPGKQAVVFNNLLQQLPFTKSNKSWSCRCLLRSMQVKQRIKLCTNSCSSSGIQTRF